MNGNGYLWLVCKNCKGTGRYKRVDKEFKDLIINVVCNCAKFAERYGDKYEGRIRVLCRECRGKGSTASLKPWQKENFRYTGKIYSTTKCPQCDGYGFPVTPKGLTNTVLTNQLLQIINTEETAHEDPFVFDPLYIVHKIPVRTIHSVIDPSMIKLARESV